MPRRVALVPAAGFVAQWVVVETWVTEYLARIAAAMPTAADDGTLRQLHRSHLLAVPFENLSVHLGEPVVLETDALVAKIVGRRRGGFCYELNGAFGALLTALGYQVDILAARTFGDYGLGIPYDHMVLRVGPWLVDVGFGSHTMYPLRWDEPGEQSDPAGSFRIERTADGDLDVLRDGELQYRAWTRPQTLRDFTCGNWWHTTSPQSHFTRSTVCSLATVDGRVSLSGNRLISTHGSERDERELGTDEEVLRAYREHFGITLERVPVVGPR
jgi:N-hydroxyarylamine O-acetyltransferase